MGIKIIDAKIVGICSKHRKEGDEIHRYKDGRIVEDENIACLAETLFSKRELSEGTQT